MRERGIFFAFMAALLLLNIIALNSIIMEQQSNYSDSASGISAMIMVNNKLDSLLAGIAEMEGENSTFNQRILPFEYSVDGNSILLQQKLPLSGASVRNYFDAINSYAIFIKDSNYSNEFDGIDVDFNAARNQEWGGSGNQLNFTIAPQCLKYRIIDLNESTLSAGNCSEQFDINNVLRYDLNTAINGEFTNDFNSVLCDFSGFADCPDMDFNSNNPLPFFQLKLNDENCMLCDIQWDLNTVRGHFNPLYDNNIIISCIPDGNSSCNSSPISIIVNEGITLLHDVSKVDIAIRATFKNPVESFKFKDLNVLARNRAFDVIARGEN